MKYSILSRVKKRKKLKTSPERMASDNEAKYVEQEERAAKRMADNDLDYKGI